MGFNLEYISESSEILREEPENEQGIREGLQQHSVQA